MARVTISIRGDAEYAVACLSAYGRDLTLEVLNDPKGVECARLLSGKEEIAREVDEIGSKHSVCQHRCLFNMLRAKGVYSFLAGS